MHWRAALAGYWAGSTGGSTSELLWDTQRDTWQAALAGYSAGSTGEPLWRDTRRDALARSSGGVLGGIHWRATLGYSAGCPAGSAGGILGGIHWRAALAGYWVGAWCRCIANADSNIKSNNPFLSGGEQVNQPVKPCS